MIEILLLIIAICELWRMIVLLNQEKRTKKIDILLTLKLKKEIGIMTQNILEQELEELEKELDKNERSMFSR